MSDYNINEKEIRTSEKEESMKYPREGKTFRSGNTGTAEVYISARDDASLEFLIASIEKVLLGERSEVAFLIPYERGNVVSDINENADVIEITYLPEGTRIRTNCDMKMQEKYREFLKL